MAKARNSGPTEGDVRMTFDMPEEMRRRLKVLAASEGKMMKDLILAWVKAGMDAMEGRPRTDRK